MKDLFHAIEMVLRSGGFSLDDKMIDPKGQGRNKPISTDHLFGLWFAAKKYRDKEKDKGKKGGHRQAK